MLTQLKTLESSALHTIPLLETEEALIDYKNSLLGKT